jgi:hypothetical protein
MMGLEAPGPQLANIADGTLRTASTRGKAIDLYAILDSIIQTVWKGMVRHEQDF